MSKAKDHKLDPNRWLEKYGDYLYNYAIVRVNDDGKAEDLVQETFLAGLKAQEQFRGESTERTWLTSILRRKIVDTYRKKYSSRESSFGEHEQTVFDGDFYRSEEPFRGHWLEGRGPHSHSLLPEGELEQAELMEYIRLCMEHLQPQLALAFSMKMIDEEESDSICKELGITPSNLWVMLHRARLKMRDCLEKNWLK
ncbi:MAG: sigma-70 family RNA polymerase sigma factor [Bacteroidales bacterium]|nr:sigma-70 family RNA polymerase sigma factor [Bacteroidales bacterium]